MRAKGEIIDLFTKAGVFNKKTKNWRILNSNKLN